MHEKKHEQAGSRRGSRRAMLRTYAWLKLSRTGQTHRWLDRWIDRRRATIGASLACASRANMRCTLQQKRNTNHSPISCSYLCQIVTDFHNSTAVRLGGKFTAQRSSEIPPNLKGVATLPCETIVSKKYCTDWRTVITAKQCPETVKYVKLVMQTRRI